MTLISKFALAAALAAATATVAFAQPAKPAKIVALTGPDWISVIDTGARKASKSMKISGLAGPLAGIDVRPADGQLYGLVADGTVVTIDIATGKATPKSKLDTMVKPGIAATVDFNPVADRLRIVGEDGTNLRANVDDGKVAVDGIIKFAEADANKGKPARVVAGAYSNSFKGTKETALYDIEIGTGVLARQAPPNDGILNTLGGLSVKVQAIAFDIQSDGNGGNMGWAVADGALHSVDIATGKVTTLGKVSGLNGAVRDIAVLPAM